MTSPSVTLPRRVQASAGGTQAWPNAFATKARIRSTVAYQYFGLRQKLHSLCARRIAAVCPLARQQTLHAPPTGIPTAFAAGPSRGKLARHAGREEGYERGVLASAKKGEKLHALAGASGVWIVVVLGQRSPPRLRASKRVSSPALTGLATKMLGVFTNLNPNTLLVASSSRRQVHSATRPRCRDEEPGQVRQVSVL